MVDDAHEPVVLPDLLEKFAGSCAGWENALPFGPDAEGLLSPGLEAYGFDYSRGDDLLACEAPPCDRRDTFGVGGLESVRGVGGEVGYLIVGFEDRLQAFPVRGGQEEFHEGLLEDTTVARTPAEDRIRTWYTVDCGL